MPAGITEYDSIFSVREMPWHGMGEILADYPSRDKAQQLVHNWEPIDAPLFRRVPVLSEAGDLVDGYEEIEGQRGIERSDNGHFLGSVSTDYAASMVTNSQMWDVAEVLMKAGAMAETGGSLEDGRKVWILLRLAEPLQVKGDPNGATLAMFSLQNGHAANASFRGQAHNVRIVCANTSAAADAEAKASGHEFTFRHTATIQDRIEQAKQALALWRSDVNDWVAMMDALNAAHVDDAQVKEFTERYQPVPPAHLATDRVRTNVYAAREQYLDVLHSVTCEGISDTAYGLFQAACEWSQHVRGLRGKDERTRMESHFKRSVLDTTGLRNSTLALVRDVAKV